MTTEEGTMTCRHCSVSIKLSDIPKPHWVDVSWGDPYCRHIDPSTLRHQPRRDVGQPRRIP